MNAIQFVPENIMRKLFFISLMVIPAFANAGQIINYRDNHILYTSYGLTTGANWVNWDQKYSNFARQGGAFQGAAAVIAFTGTGIKWIGGQGPNYGYATVSMDGGAPVWMDNYAPTSTSTHENAVFQDLKYGTHILKIEVTPYKNPASSGEWQGINWFDIDGAAAFPNGAAGWNLFRLAGNWSGGWGNSQDLSTGHVWSFASGASLSWNFKGNVVAVWGRPDVENGSFDVYIDGVWRKKVDETFGYVDDDALNADLIFTATELGDGNHEIQLVHSGTNGSAVQIDVIASYE
jgi:hypothetical protein